MSNIEHPRYIVLLRHPGGMWLPLVDADDTPAGFATEESATEAAKENPLGNAYGALVVDTDDCVEV